MKMNFCKKKSQFINNGIKVALCIMLMVSTLASAQNIGKIEGRLLSSTNKPVILATATLFSLPDSLLVKGVITDTTGHFEYSNLPLGSYVIKFRNIGYDNAIVDSIVLSSATQVIDLHSIIMEEDVVNLTEVEIVGERIKGTVKVDRIVYPVSEKVAAVSHTGLELLRMVPAVQVDFSKNISLEGSTNILIYVDDRIRDKNYLAQLDPKTIDKIEVMTNPSVKYGADVSGVIHIKLKKDRKSGFSGGFGGEQSLNRNALYTDFRINMEYGTNKYRIYVSGLGDYQKFMASYGTNRDALDGSYGYIQNSQGKDTYGGSDVNYGIDWFIDDKNTINFYGYCSPKNGLSSNADETKEWFTNGSTNKYLTNYPTVRSGSDNSEYYGAFYKLNFSKTGQVFTLDANYLFHRNIVDNTYNEQYYMPDKLTPDGELLHRAEKSDNYQEAFYAKADYSHPFSEKLMLYIGYQNNTQWNTNNFTHTSDAVSTIFKYNEVRHAAYLNLTGKIKEFSWQGGLRFEYSNIQIDEEINTGYVCLLPQVSFQQKINDKQSVKLSYRLSIQRPDIVHLNPFVYYIDSLNVTSGNPNLKPAYYNKLELSYPVEFGVNFFSPGVFVNAYTDGFEQVKNVTGNRSETFTDNVGKGIEYGLNLSGAFNITKWWVLNPYFSVTIKEIKEVLQYDVVGINKVSFMTYISSVFNLPKKFSVTNTFYHGSPYISSSQNITQHGSTWIFGVNKQLFKNDAGKISIITFNPFSNKYLMHETEVSNKNFIEVSNWSLIISNYWAIQFSYNFQLRGNKIKKLNDEKNAPIGRGKGIL